jgi:5-methylcytosine-specific restriction protein B
MAHNPDWNHLYQAYQNFSQACLVEDRSLLWPDRALWIADNVSELKHVLVDAPAMGKESFEEKLIIQMAGQPPELWGVLADSYYLFCLVPGSREMKANTKQTGITNFAKKGHLTVPDDKNSIWNGMEPGICTTGQRYMQKYRQFWLILIFAEQIKQNPNRRGLLNDRQAMQNLLDSCLEMIPTPGDRAYDLRHALLYLAFPDYYERVISTGDKKNIIAGFKNRLSGEVPADLDAAIHEIRQVLENDESLVKPLDFYQPQLKPLWKNIEKPIQIQLESQPTSLPGEPAEAVFALLPLFNHTKNVIIYGPPGTGKTYIANQAAHELIKKQLEEPITEAVLFQSIAEANTFYDLLALALFRAGNGKRFDVRDIHKLPIIQARFSIRPVKNPNENIWAYLQSHTSPESKTVNVANRGEPYLFDKDKDGSWYLTDDGIEYVEQTLGESLATLKQPLNEVNKAENFITRVAFHQSYAYEDFVEGFRPVGTNDIDIVPGKFREVCAQAAGNPTANYVLIIDEINRGNISKIFGELITLLEDDKRDGQPASFPIELAYSHLKFKVPNNLYILGTMNTTDRSIALLDVALRRRFAFYELLPDPELLQGKIIQSEDGDQLNLETLLRALNQRIYKELGADYQIGHSYLLNVNSLASLEFAWNNQILPLLQEYFYSQPERLAEILEPYMKGQENSDDLRREGSDLIVALSELTK